MKKKGHSSACHLMLYDTFKDYNYSSTESNLCEVQLSVHINTPKIPFLGTVYYTPNMNGMFYTSSDFISTSTWSLSQGPDIYLHFSLLFP